MSRDRTNFSRVINPHRMTDAEYCTYLEEEILKISDRVGEFMTKMDEASHTRNAQNVFSAYVENIDLLRLKTREF